MNNVKAVTLKDALEEGKFRSMVVGESDVELMVLVANPDGVFYTTTGDTAGRYFLPMHMIMSIEMADETVQ